MRIRRRKILGMQSELKFDYLPKARTVQNIRVATSLALLKIAVLNRSVDDITHIRSAVAIDATSR